MRRHPWELAVWAGGALFCKREGLPLVGVGLALLLLSQERARWWRSAWLVAALSLPWWLFVSRLPGDLAGVSAVTSRVSWPALACWGPGNLLRILFQMGFEPRTWSLFWWTGLVALLSPARWERSDWLPLAFCLGYTPVLLLVFLPVSPDVWDWNTVNRTLLPLTGAGLLFIASRFPSRPL